MIRTRLLLASIFISALIVFVVIADPFPIDLTSFLNLTNDTGVIENSSETINTTILSHKYTEGDILAWNGDEWEDRCEYGGRVLGKVVAIERNVPWAERSIEQKMTGDRDYYLVLTHPFYRYEPESELLEHELDLHPPLAFYACDYLDNVTEKWNEPVDWNASFEYEENGTVSGLHNDSGTFYLVNGTFIPQAAMLKMAAEAPGPGPIEFPDPLRLRLSYRCDDETGENALSISIKYYRYMDHYWLESNDTIRDITPKEGYTFLRVLVGIYHLGHKGDTNQYQALTPPESAFRLYYNGYNYTALPVRGIIKDGGRTYNQTLVERYENIQRFLVFEVPDTIVPKKSYIQLDLGERGSAVWSLVRPWE